MLHIAEESISNIDDGRLVPAGLAAEHSSHFLCSTVTCYPYDISWLEVPMPISLCVGVRSISFLGRALAGPNCVLECRKEGAPGWE